MRIADGDSLQWHRVVRRRGRRDPGGEEDCLTRRRVYPLDRRDGRRRSRRSGGHSLATAIAIWIVGVAGMHVAIAAQAPAPTTHRLQVTRYSGIELPDEEVDATLAEMGRLLCTDDDGAGPNDVACAVEFVRDGTVGAFDTGSGVISSPEERDEVFSASWHGEGCRDHPVVRGQSRDQFHVLRMLKPRPLHLCSDRRPATYAGRGSLGARVRTHQGPGAFRGAGQCDEHARQGRKHPRE